MTKIKKKCLLCQNEIVFFGSFSEYDFYTPSSKIFYCKKCDLFQKKLDKANAKKINIDYYQNYTNQELLNRSINRKILDVPRSLNYISIISKFVKLKNISYSVDIGGAEGLFSNVLNDQFPNINTFNIEPDPKAVKIGKKLYPNVCHEVITGEEFFKNSNHKIKFDLITYFGGIYRSAAPFELIKNISLTMSKSSLAVFTLPFSIDNPTNQAGQTYQTIGDIFGNDTMTFFDIKTLENLLKIFFEYTKVEIYRNKPFFKDIPFLVAMKPRKLVNEFKYINTSSKKNLRFVNSFYSKKSEQKLKTFLNKNNIVNFYGSEKMSFFLKQFCSKNNYKFNDFSNLKDTKTILEGNKINNILEKNEQNIFIFDKLTNSSIVNFEQICRRLNLFRFKPCLILCDGVSIDDQFLNFSSFLIFKKTIKIEQFTG